MRGILTGAAIALAFSAGSAIAAADGTTENQTLTCDNGRIYQIRVRAVSEAGELVTGYIVIGPRKRTYFRLVPMGNGYRYAGNGFWFDGVRNMAQLTLGRNNTTACTVS
jgi:hypothetical protein